MSAGPRYWTYATARAAALSRVQANGRSYFIFQTQADGAYHVSAHAEPTEGCLLVEEVRP